MLCRGLPGCWLRHWKQFGLRSSRAFLLGAVSPGGVVVLMLGRGGNGESRQASWPWLTGRPEKPQVSGLGMPQPPLWRRVTHRRWCPWRGEPRHGRGSEGGAGAGVVLAVLMGRV